MAAFVKVAKTDEIAFGQAVGVEVNGKGLALFNIDGNFYALDDTCTHKGGPLSEGAIAGEEVTCPWHKAKFNIRTGHVLSPPARRGVRRYNIRVMGTNIEVEV
jgi:nitrite reductase/ring-hydroxylating ferredoxin subunit